MDLPSRRGTTTRPPDDIDGNGVWRSSQRGIIIIFFFHLVYVVFVMPELRREV